MHFFLSQALYVNPLDCYNIHWPIRRGQLNIHPGPGGSLTAVLADIEVIWSHAIQKYLEIPLKDLKVRGNSCVVTETSVNTVFVTRLCICSIVSWKHLKTWVVRRPFLPY
jgi:hypothetical protein